MISPLAIYKNPRYTALMRYLFVGGSAFATEYLSFLALYSGLHAQVYVANTVSFGLGFIISFTLNRAWSFKGGRYKRAAHHQFAMYLTLAGCNVLLTNLLIGGLKHLGLDPRIGKIACMFFIVCWNFFIFRFVIFAQHADSKDQSA